MIFSPLLLPTDYKLHKYTRDIFSQKKSGHTRQTEKTQGKEKEEKNCPKNIGRPGAIKFGAIVPTSRRVSPFMPLVNQASPILAPIKGFFSFLVQKIIGSRDLAVFFLEKKIQSLSNTVFSYIYLKLPHYFRIDTITVWGEACGGKRGRRGIHSSETKCLCLMELSSEILKLCYISITYFKIRKMKTFWVLKKNKYVAKFEAFA